MDVIIDFKGVSKWYGEVIGLNNVTTTIGPGITGLLGHNGAGKTTFISLVTGQLKPSIGRIRVFGKNPWNNPGVLNRIGYCPEVDSFWPGISGYAFVCVLGQLSGFSRRQARQRAIKVIEQVGMTDHMKRPVLEYSRGMRQRIKIAQALLHDPSLLVLDEPLSGMDPVIRSDMKKLFFNLAGKGTTILVSSHVLYEVQVLTDKFLMVSHGRQVAQGDVHEVRRLMDDYAHTILIKTDKGRLLATELMGQDFVAGIELSKSGDLFVQTYNPDQLYDKLPRILIDLQINCTEISSKDESLEAIFNYLTETGR